MSALAEFFREVTMLPRDNCYLEIQRHIGSKYYQHFWRDPEKAAEYVRMHNTGNIFFGVCPRKMRRGRAIDVAYIPCLWVDLDKRVPPALLNGTYERIPKPSITVGTGGYEHAHLYWLLRKPWPVSRRIAEILEGLRQRLGADTTQDISRRLRVPWTYNWKHKGRPMVWASTRSWERYHLSGFDHLRASVQTHRSVDVGVSEPADLDMLGLSPQVLERISGDTENLPEHFYRQDGTIDRSRLDMSIARQLAAHDCTPEQVRWVLENYPCSGRVQAIQHKEAYILHTVRRVFEDE